MPQRSWCERWWRRDPVPRRKHRAQKKADLRGTLGDRVSRRNFCDGLRVSAAPVRTSDDARTERRTSRNGNAGRALPCERARASCALAKREVGGRDRQRVSSRPRLSRPPTSDLTVVAHTADGKSRPSADVRSSRPRAPNPVETGRRCRRTIERSASRIARRVRPPSPGQIRARRVGPTEKSTCGTDRCVLSKRTE